MGGRVLFYYCIILLLYYCILFYYYYFIIITIIIIIILTEPRTVWVRNGPAASGRGTRAEQLTGGFSVFCDFGCVSVAGRSDCSLGSKDAPPSVNEQHKKPVSDRCSRL
jgi:hypothetical protein